MKLENITQRRRDAENAEKRRETQRLKSCAVLRATLRPLRLCAESNRL
jgi:hypothetical protein